MVYSAIFGVISYEGCNIHIVKPNFGFTNLKPDAAKLKNKYHFLIIDTFNGYPFTHFAKQNPFTS